MEQNSTGLNTAKYPHFQKSLAVVQDIKQL